MAWTNPINTAIPADSDLVANGADAIRDLKLALQERLATVLAGWPTSQPLYVAACSVGPLASRPAALIVGQMHIDSGSGQGYYVGLGLTWNVLGTGNPSDVGGVQALSAFTVDNISTCPVATPVWQARFNFTRQSPSAKVRIKMDGVELVLLSEGTSSPYSMTITITEGTHSFEASQVVAGVEGPAITRTQNFIDPCDAPVFAPPFNLDVDEEGACVGSSSNNKAALTWTNDDPTMKVRVYREKLGDAPAMVAELAAGISSYDDTTVEVGTDEADSTFNYWVTHYNPVGPVESFASGSVSFVAVNLCPEE